MDGAMIGLLALVVALVLVVVAGALWLSRTRALVRRVGSFSCLLAEQEAGPWRAGIAEYGRKRLYWWRRASLAPRAAAIWHRSGLTVLERHGVPVERAPGQRPVAVVVRCRLAAADASAEVWLQMSPDAYAGFTSWIEATPTSVGSVI